ncbi:putative oxidoreductase [Smittium culicis]|uniref:Putative oxidoreductase n=1 Tax=Smittium culicis TaxID=133412 RepID=A0A1R1Y7I0_9FUNG|nr:putative oxidoreductase [Smittium culicis]
MDGAETERVVIIGGGVVGVSSAYFLSQHYEELNKGSSSNGQREVDIVLVERTGLASCASGAAGGFLAKGTFHQGADIEELSTKGFDLHQQLADELDGYSRYGYRRVSTYSVECSPNAAKASNLASEKVVDSDTEISWLKQDAIISSMQIGSASDTAQVTPKLLVETLWQEASSRGARLVLAGVTDIKRENAATVDKRLHKYTVTLSNGSSIAATKVLVCMGPWTYYAREYQIFADMPKSYFEIYGLLAHNSIFKPKEQIPAQALFVSISGSKYKDGDEIEFYPRPDNTLFVCGEALDDAIVIPKELDGLGSSSGGVGKPSSFNKLASIYNNLMNGTDEVSPVSTGAGYLPVRNSGLPVISRIGQLDGVFVGAGHSCWGILNGPITGLLLSQLCTNQDDSTLLAVKNLDMFRIDRFLS